MSTAGAARSNYFRVKDPEAFRAWVSSIPHLRLWDEKSDGTETLFGIYSDEPDSGRWPGVREGAGGELTDIDLQGELYPHLQDGSVAVLMSVSIDKLRYIGGYAVAINSKGEWRMVHTDDIYDVAKGLGEEINLCER